MARWRVGDVDYDLTVAVGPSSGVDPVQEVTDFGAVSLTFDFSTGDGISFAVSGTSVEAAFIDELATDVWLYGKVEQRYRIITANQDWNEDGGDVIAVGAVSYKRLLKQRHVGPGGLSFVGVDQGDILWELVDHTQSRPGGDWGVTQGVTATGVLRDREYVEGDNLGALAENLQNVINGPWWTINAARVLSARLPSSFGFIAQPIQLGVNARKLSRQSAADRFANSIYGDASQETTTPVWVDAADILTDPRGRWERAFGWPTVTDQDTLVEHATGALGEVNTPVAGWRIAMEPTRWLSDSFLMPGDKAVLVVPPTTAAPIGAGPGTVNVQVTETSVTFNADGALEVTLAAIEQ